MSRLRNVSRRGWIVVAVVAAVMGAGAITAPVAASSNPTVSGGITVYQVKRPCCRHYATLGSEADPTTIAVKAVPPGTYLVTGMIGVGSQPGSYIVCALSNALNGNDGIFGDYATTTGGAVSVSETEVVTTTTGQSITSPATTTPGRPATSCSRRPSTLRL